MINRNELIPDKPGSVIVLIGANGSGKSRLLRDHCLRLVRNGQHVLAIAPSLFDRFRGIRKKKFKFFGARQGQRAAERVIRSALLRASRDDPQVLKNLVRALDYTKFDPVVGIKVCDLNLERMQKGLRQADEDRDQKAELVSLLRRWQRLAGKDEIVRLRLESFSFDELQLVSLGGLAQYETKLKKMGALSRIEYFLFRQGQAIPLLQACSGELVFVTSMAFIAANIARQSVIAIDEPETSLHPNWQKGYVDTLLDLFGRYEPRIVISTHSPILISGAEAGQEKADIAGEIEVFAVEQGTLKKFQHAKLSLEEMYDKLFNLITPKNHHLSKQAVGLLNALNRRAQTLPEVMAQFHELKERSYDETQKAAIDKLEALAVQIAETKQ